MRGGRELHRRPQRCKWQGSAWPADSLLPPPTRALFLFLCSDTDFELPFDCPVDMLLPISRLDELPQLAYRMPGFLDSPALPYIVCHSSAPVNGLPRKPEAGTLGAPASHGLGAVAGIWPGIREGELRRALAAVGDVAVLHIRWVGESLLPPPFPLLS